jgi:hypothetical protein
MRKQLLTALCASCLVIGARAQTSTDPSNFPGSPSSGHPGYSGLSGTSDSQSGWTGRMNPTGHMGHQELRASQLMGAEVTSGSGGQIGRIRDVIINPGAGRIDFAVLSLSFSEAASAGGATSPSGRSSSSGTSADTSSSGSSSAVGGSSTTGGSGLGSSSSTRKQVVVPWMLLRSSSTGVSSTSQPSFVFMGDTTKIESAPGFDATADLSQPGWRHSVFSYFGLSSGAATGGSESPGGSFSSGSLPNSTSGSPK